MNGIDESLSSLCPGPQSPCERTDLRMAIVADHLGLSWTGEKHSALHLFLPLRPLLTLLPVFGPISLKPWYLLPPTG